jgi:hypothetical protein
MLNFVLVPVPREHVLEVMRWVLYRAEVDASARELDHARFSAYLADARPEIRKLLELVATSTLAGEAPILRDVADMLGHEGPPVEELVDEVNHAALDEGREAIETWHEPVVGVDGRRSRHVFVAMRRDLAELIRRRGGATRGG